MCKPKRSLWHHSEVQLIVQLIVPELAVDHLLGTASHVALMMIQLEDGLPTALDPVIEHLKSNELLHAVLSSPIIQYLSGAILNWTAAALTIFPQR